MRNGREIETSVWVVTDDHPPDLGRYASALLGQRGAEPYELVLVDVIGAADYRRALADAAERCASPPPYRVIDLPGAGRARGYNAARDAASPGADLVIFFADDFIAPDSLVSAHRAFHRARPQQGAVGIGAALLADAHRGSFANWLEASGELYGAPFHPGMREIPPSFFYVGNASVKRSLLERAGRLDERFRHHAIDDQEFGERLIALGMESHYVPDALAVHEHPISLSERRRVMRNVGEAAHVFESRHGTPGHWRRALRRSPLRHRLDAVRHGLGHVLTGSPRRRARYYRSLLHASFSSGYRAAAPDA